MLGPVPIVPPHAVEGVMDCLVVGEAIVGGARRRIFARVRFVLRRDGVCEETFAPQVGGGSTRLTRHAVDVLPIIEAISDPPTAD